MGDDTPAGADERTGNNMVLFWASFLTLVAAGIGFSVRGTAVLADWGKQFGFTQTELGGITGGGLTGFGIAIIVFSVFSEWFGYGKLMAIAFLLHASSAVVTFLATPMFNAYGKDGAYICLNAGMWLFALGNGTCEAVINPLTATLFPKNKTHWLNILHAGWPAGLILGALIMLGFDKLGAGTRWEYKIAVFLIPTLLYGLLMFGRRFPASEASASGVDLGTMAGTLLAPMLLFLFLLHALVGYVELGTDSWISNITGNILDDPIKGLYLFIWTSGLMLVLRFFAGPIVHRISPLGLLFASACLGAAGLVMLGSLDGVPMIVLAATVYGFGKTFLWPTMLGVVSERFPRGGALALGVSGGIGMISAGLLGGPGIGYKQDYFATQKLQAVSPDTYERYKSDTKKSFLVFPEIAGIDNGKAGVLKDSGKVLSEDYAKLTEAQKNDPKNELAQREKWWEQTGKPNAESDKKAVEEATLYGSRQALIYTAAIPATMAVGYLLLILYFSATGGYKQIHLETSGTEKPTGEY